MAVDMFLKLDGIKGESLDDKHKGEIDVLAWSWGLSQSGTSHMGGGGGAGKVNVQDLSFTKYVDKATTPLVLATCNGQHIKQALLTVRKAGKSPVEYIKITLDQIMVTSVSTGGSGGEDRLTENVTLNFAKFKVEYAEQKADGTALPPTTVAWDIPCQQGCRLKITRHASVRADLEPRGSTYCYVSALRFDPGPCERRVARFSGMSLVPPNSACPALFACLWQKSSLTWEDQIPVCRTARAFVLFFALNLQEGRKSCP